MYKTRNLEKLEKLENFESDILINAINTRYTADIDALRNLASLAKNILDKNDTFEIPATNTTVRNMRLSGDLTVEGNIKFTKKDENILEIFPRYMVIPWAKAIFNTATDIPKGWAICNGSKYIITSSGICIEANTDPLAIPTPDLRGRFVLGAGVGATDMNNKNLTARTFGQSGGEEGHVLTELELAPHTHRYHLTRYVSKYDSYNAGSAFGEGDYRIWVTNDPADTTFNTGGNLRPNTGKKYEGADNDYPDPAIYDGVPHNNMPPFYVLTYIMKL